jgi:hypothetical protein
MADEPQLPGVLQRKWQFSLGRLLMSVPLLAAAIVTAREAALIRLWKYESPVFFLYALAACLFGAAIGMVFVGVRGLLRGSGVALCVFTVAWLLVLRFVLNPAGP